jgi:SAM-dependent methyltransferase
MSTAERLQSFVEFCQKHITGDEKGEAQIFLDRFFRAFGHEGAMEAGAVYEKRIKKGSKTGRTGFADLVWKPRVLIEMKKRGADLSKHYSQAFDYWQRAVPDRPRYVLLCNFDQFWVYDFNIQIDTPVDYVALVDLPDRAGVFGFMEVREQRSVFGNNQVEVTEKAARRLGRDLYPGLRDRIKRQQKRSQGDADLIAQRFVLQCVLAMFAEDRGLLPESLFVRCVQDCINGESSYDVISLGLFREMNTPGMTAAGRFAGVDYFNGGLFATIDSLDLTLQELKILEVAALEDWGKVRPAIFGNIFESAIDQSERHAQGIHYTSEADIMQIVRPTISRFWEEKIEAANTIAALELLQAELRDYRVLDPACGSGNFLYLAYQELKRIERDLLDKIAERRRSPRDQIQMGFVTPLQFFGIDKNPFAVELARVTLTIARKVAIDRLDLLEPALPLDTLDNNVVCEDALFYKWPRANVIIGNPPFLGGKTMRKNLGEEYLNRIFTKFSDVKDSVDFCAYWFRIAHQNLDLNGSAGLVATNSISQGKSRKASLDYIIKNGGIIHEAISSQVWSGDANVHVSITNWSYKKTDICYLDNEPVEHINSSLKSLIDISQSYRLTANMDRCYTGVTPVGKGFIVSSTQAQAWIKEDPRYASVVVPLLEGGVLASGVLKKLDQWIIDFNNMSLEEASTYKKPFQWVEESVKPERFKNRRSTYKDYWWKLGEKRSAMRQALKNLSQYFAVPQTSKWAIFVPCSINWLPNARTRVVASEDFYLLGVLTSALHRVWMHSQKSTLKADISYTHNTCFETFPFPQTPSEKIVQQIRQTAIDLHDYRSQMMEKHQYGITKLYNQFFHEPASQLYKLHKQLDQLTLQAYGFSKTDDLLEQLLNLNLQLAAKEKAGEPIIGPWDPSQPPKPHR